MIETIPTKKTAGALVIFYFLVGFEIVYMISPFGLYYYSVYGLGLDFLTRHPATAWLCSFFLPHMARTASPLLNEAKSVGWGLALAGLASFCVDAATIYYAKLARRGPVLGGVYRYIRHPQYLSLIICSFGLLLVWPRNIVLVMFVTVVFAHYFLACAEERECSARFGPTFDEYVAHTGMFLPFGARTPTRFLPFPTTGFRRRIAIFGTYLVVLGAALALAHAMRLWSIQALYARYSDNSAVVSLDRMDAATMDSAAAMTLSDPAVLARTRAIAAASSARFILYVMPAEWFMSDLPMRMDGHKGHVKPEIYDHQRLKVLVMAADNVDTGSDQLLLAAPRRMPLAEARIDLREGRVISVEEPPSSVRWGDIPTPLF